MYDDVFLVGAIVLIVALAVLAWIFGDDFPNQRRSQNVANQTHAAAAQAALKAAGFDWQNLFNVIKNLPWAQVLAIVEQLLAGTQARAAAAAGAACCPEDLKSHFQAIQCIAACGANCCDACTP